MSWISGVTSPSFGTVSVVTGPAQAVRLAKSCGNFGRTADLLAQLQVPLQMVLVG